MHKNRRRRRTVYVSLASFRDEHPTPIIRYHARERQGAYTPQHAAPDPSQSRVDTSVRIRPAPSAVSDTSRVNIFAPKLKLLFLLSGFFSPHSKNRPRCHGRWWYQRRVVSRHDADQTAYQVHCGSVKNDLPLYLPCNTNSRHHAPEHTVVASYGHTLLSPYRSKTFIFVVSPARGREGRVEHVLSMGSMPSGSMPCSCGESKRNGYEVRTRT